MPEGPSLVILREQAQIFKGQRVLAAEGNSKIDKTRIVGQRIVALRTWGKHFLIEFREFTIRIHLLMSDGIASTSASRTNPSGSGRFANDRELNFAS